MTINTAAVYYFNYFFGNRSEEVIRAAGSQLLI